VESAGRGLTRHAADSLRSPLMPRLGIARTHPCQPPRPRTPSSTPSFGASRAVESPPTARSRSSRVFPVTHASLATPSTHFPMAAASRGIASSMFRVAPARVPTAWATISFSASCFNAKASVFHVRAFCPLPVISGTRLHPPAPRSCSESHRRRRYQTNVVRHAPRPALPAPVSVSAA
jgi:hypothetical protein